jgi:dUTP pyrophosphatase
MDRLRVETTSSAARPAIRATSSSAGLDLSLLADITLRNQAITIVELPYKVAIPDGHVGLLTLRSSLGARGITIPNSVGVIDSDYRGNLKLPLALLHDSGPVILRAGERVAQIVILPAAFPTPVETEVAADETARGAAGLGSTGTAALPNKEDVVNRPSHYAAYEPEVIVVTERLNFCEGNVIKYLARAGKKPGAPEQLDLDKAHWYMCRIAYDKDGAFNRDALTAATSNILGTIAALTPAASRPWQAVFDAAAVLAQEIGANA